MIQGSIQDSNFQSEGRVLFIDKPIDWTSFDVVKKVKVLFKEKKVGHAGTLDPKATGLLIVCTGRKTKKIEDYTCLEKEYIGTFEIGIRTPSFDRETNVCEQRDHSSINETVILETAKSFTGKQLQLPPMYSAVKYGGLPLYQYARTGRTVERTQREVNIFKFEICHISIPFIDFCIVCTKGTYIRSLIDEFGQRLGTGAVLNSLRRVRIGQFKVEDAKTIGQLTEWKETYFNAGLAANADNTIH